MSPLPDDPAADLEALARALGQAAPALGESSNEIAPMSRALQRLHLAFGDSTALAASPRAARALLAFRSGEELRFIDLKHLCHAAGQPNPWDGRRLLEDGRLLEQLLLRVERWGAEPRRFRQCYRGLLLAAREAQEGPGRRQLLAYLERHRTLVAGSQPALGWTRALAGDAPLLAPPPETAAP